MKFQPDDTDWKIIEILREGHVPNNAIAAELGVSEGMVRQRIKRLKDNHILTVRALINPEVLENKQLATIAVNVKESRLLDDKAQEISLLDGVLYVNIVSGQFDLLVEVLLDSNRGLVTFLTETLSKVQGISATQSFITLKSFNQFV
jgi:Lrp/AsnC family transcriptional regulator for asnA, asnC and gidA